MDVLPVPPTPAAAVPRNCAAELPRLGEEEVPLGWECANPALQIERWGLDDTPLSSNS